MGTHPSKRFEDGVLVERAIATPVAGESVEKEATATKPYKTPLRTPRSSEDREAYAKERAGKAVQSAENKAVEAEETKKPRRRTKK